MEKKDFEAGEIWWQNFNSITSQIQKQKTKQKRNQETSIRLNIRITVESFKGSYKLNCDQLLDMQRTKS